MELLQEKQPKYRVGHTSIEATDELYLRPDLELVGFEGCRTALASWAGTQAPPANLGRTL